MPYPKHVPLSLWSLLLLTVSASVGCSGVIETPTPPPEAPPPERHDLLTAQPRLFLRVEPGALVVGKGAKRTVAVIAYDEQGAKVDIRKRPLVWTSSQPNRVSVKSAGENKATVQAAQTIGFAHISARLKDDPSVVAEPLRVMVAELQTGVTTVADDKVVFPPPRLPPGKVPASLEIKDIVRPTAGKPGRIGPFSYDEVFALADTRPHGDGTHDVFTPVVLRGVAPKKQARLLASEQATIMGEVVQVVARDGFALVQLRRLAPQSLFQQATFGEQRSELAARGLAPMEPPLSSATHEMAGSSPLRQAQTLDLLSQCRRLLADGTTAAIDVMPISVTQENEFQQRVIWDMRFDVQQGRLRSLRMVQGFELATTAKIGVLVQAQFEVGLRCPLSRPWRKAVAAPGVLGFIIGGSMEGMPILDVVVSGSGGPSFEAGLEQKVTTGFQMGFQWDEGRGLTNLSRAWVNPEETKPKLMGNLRGFLTGDPEPFKVGWALGVKALANINVEFFPLFDPQQMSWLNLGAHGGALQQRMSELTDRLQIEVIEGTLGPEVNGSHESLGQVLFARSSDSKVHTQIVGGLNAKLDIREVARQVIAAPAPAADRDRLRADIDNVQTPALPPKGDPATDSGAAGGVTPAFHLMNITGAVQVSLLTLHTALTEDEVTVDGRPINGTVTVRPGDTIDLRATPKLEREAELDDETPQIQQWLTPKEGEIWLGTRPWRRLRDLQANAGTLAAQLTVTPELCQVLEEQGPVVQLVGYNKVFGVVSSPGAVGTFFLRCGDTPNNPPPPPPPSDECPTSPGARMPRGPMTCTFSRDMVLRYESRRDDLPWGTVWGFDPQRDRGLLTFPAREPIFLEPQEIVNTGDCGSWTGRWVRISTPRGPFWNPGSSVAGVWTSESGWCNGAFHASVGRYWFEPANP